MNDYPLGDFEINLSGNILIAKLKNDWNEKGALNLFETFKMTISLNNLTDYGTIVDFSDFTGATIDALEYFHKINVFGFKHGQKKLAVIHNNEFKDLFSSRINNSNSNDILDNIKEFNTIESAMVFFYNNGYNYELIGKSKPVKSLN